MDSTTGSYTNVNQLSSYTDIRNYIQIFITQNYFSDSASTTPYFLMDKKILYGPYKLNIVKAKTSSCDRGINIDQYNTTKNGVTYTVHWYADSSNLSDVIDKSDTTTFKYQ